MIVDPRKLPAARGAVAQYKPTSAAMRQYVFTMKSVPAPAPPHSALIGDSEAYDVRLLVSVNVIVADV